LTDFLEGGKIGKIQHFVGKNTKKSLFFKIRVGQMPPPNDVPAMYLNHRAIGSEFVPMKFWLNSAVVISCTSGTIKIYEYGSK